MACGGARLQDIAQVLKNHHMYKLYSSLHLTNNRGPVQFQFQRFIVYSNPIKGKHWQRIFLQLFRKFNTNISLLNDVMMLVFVFI